MANQAEPGTMGGGAREPASFGGAATAGYAAASPDTFGTAAQGQQAVGFQTPGSPSPVYHPFHGRSVSWVAVSLIMAGFIVGGLALVFGHHGPTWWLFWVGVGVAAVGSLLALVTDIFEDWY